MAFVPSTYWTIGFQFSDNNGNVADTAVHAPASMAYADVVALAANLATDLQSVSDARLTGFLVYSRSVNDDVSPIAASSEVERKLHITMGTATDPAATRMQVPSPVFALEQPRTDVVDPTYPGFVQLTASLTAGNIGANNGPVTYYGADLTRITKAIITHRARKPRS